MAIKFLKSQDFNWINIENLEVEKDIQYLKGNFKFHPLDYEDVIASTQRPKVDIYNNYLFLVLHFPQFDSLNNRLGIDEVKIFINKKSLITITKGRSKALSDYFYKRLAHLKIRKNGLTKDPLKGTTGYLLYKILEVLFKSNMPLLDLLGIDIKKVEEEIYEGKTKLGVKNLAVLNHNILYFRNIIDPHRFIINALLHTKKEFLPQQLDVYFDNIRDYIENIWVTLGNYKDLVSSLNETNESLISHHTSEVIKILTIFSVSLLPLTLLSGIYGMNIDLPFSNNPRIIWIMFGLVFTFIILVILAFKRKDWL